MFEHSTLFSYVPEWEGFLSLFPHRHSYLWAEHPLEGSPEWYTEDRHPLSDRLILQGAYLYGVRFGKATNYLMLDVDAGSPYHPNQDAFALSRIVDALEPLGLSRYVAVTSSHSGGLHLYFPFVMGQSSWAIAAAAAALMESIGCRLVPGQLELFPNPRGFSESKTAYNGHRLPLQRGSYLVDKDWQPIFTSWDSFVRQWQLSENYNTVSKDQIDLILKQYERKRWMFLKHSARKFLNDLNAEVERGWTGFGQSNRLIGRIALREYIFFHVLHGGAPLSGVDLQMRIIQVASGLPGFKQWSRHESDLHSLATYWARCVERSPRYYPYGKDSLAESPPTADEPSPNQLRAQDARCRLENAVRELCEAGQFPQGTRARIYALKAKGLSSDTLYKHKDLWHPEKQLEPASDGVIRAIEEEKSNPRSLEPASDGVIRAIAPISFMCDQNCPSHEGDSDAHTETQGGSGGSFPQPLAPPVGVEHVRRALANIQRRRAAPPPSLASPPPDESWFNQSPLTEDDYG